MTHEGCRPDGSFILQRREPADKETVGRAYGHLFDVVGAPYPPTKCEKCGHIGYPGHACELRQRLQAAERLARMVIEMRLGASEHNLAGFTIRCVQDTNWDAMLAAAREVLGEKP